MTVKAVLFDMDGVIFDSERAVVDSWVVVADEEGIPDIESFCVKALRSSQRLEPRAQREPRFLLSEVR